jgi:hypothetical protein
MIKKEFRKHKKLNNILTGLNNSQIIVFDEIYDKHINKPENSISKMFRRCETLVSIIKNNDDNYESLFLEYFSTTSDKIKLKIKYGPQKVEEYTQKLKVREKPKVPHSIFDYKFWIRKGYTEEESKNKVKEIQLNNVKKRTKQSYKNFSEKLKHSVDYWMKMGYSLEESEILRIPYLSQMKNDLDSFIEKYGEYVGVEKWLKRCLKYKESIKQNISTRRTAGYVSKESLKFFIPLYKFCRRLGLNRNEIYFGIKGSREFFIKDIKLNENGGRFYDFCIPKLNLIIEYHGTFWHPKNIEEWNNPWINYHDAFELDCYKENLAKQRKMEYHVVWSDDSFEQRLSEIQELIKRKYYDL